MKSSDKAPYGPATRPSPRPKQHGIVRAQSGPVGYQALPEVFKRLTVPTGMEDGSEGVSIEVSQLQHPTSMPSNVSRQVSARQVSEEQAQQIFDRLYNSA